MTEDTTPPEPVETEEVVDAETGEIVTAPKVPRVRTLDQIVNRANGGQYRDEMPRMIEAFFSQMFVFAQDYGVNAKGSMTVVLKAEVDPYGEVAVELKPAIKLPDPPLSEGKARMFMHADGSLVTHQQHEMPLFKDTKKRDQKLRDPGARKKD